MAVTSNVYLTAVDFLLTAGIDLDGDDLKIALLDDTAVFATTDSSFDDLSASEITGTGYTAGGETLSSVVVDLGAELVTLAADDVTWVNATFSAYAAVVYADRVGTPLLVYIDFNAENAPSVEDFVIDFGSGVLIAEAGSA